MGLNIGDTTLYTLHCADDVVIAEDKKPLEYMGRKLYKEYVLCTEDQHITCTKAIFGT